MLGSRSFVRSVANDEGVGGALAFIVKLWTFIVKFRGITGMAVAVAGNGIEEMRLVVFLLFLEELRDFGDFAGDGVDS